MRSLGRIRPGGSSLLSSSPDLCVFFPCPWASPGSRSARVPSLRRPRHRFPYRPPLQLLHPRPVAVASCKSTPFGFEEKKRPERSRGLVPRLFQVEPLAPEAVVGMLFAPKSFTISSIHLVRQGVPWDNRRSLAAPLFFLRDAECQNQPRFLWQDLVRMCANPPNSVTVY